MKILLGMSGGVDSSVAAWLLRDAGHEVVGLTFRIWDQRVRTTSTLCCSEESTAAAAAVCDMLDMPHRSIDTRGLFREKVIEPFCTAYLAGQTPNPCILCNRRLKFPELLRLADAMGAAAVATGHYARIEERRGHRTLLQARDSDKDQSYFLYGLRPAELARTRFPLGALTKAEVRDIAHGIGLPTADRPESQDICFVGAGGYRAFIAELAPEHCRPGPFVDRNGTLLGEHRGIAFYTVGQRRGLGVAAGERRYVIQIRSKDNTIVLGPRQAGLRRELRVHGVHWIETPRDDRLSCRVRLRSTMVPQPAAVVRESATAARIRFEDAQWAPAAGQAAVFYRNDEVLGGGTIVEGGTDP